MTYDHMDATILVIEDDPASLRAITGIFGQSYNLLIATSGRDAIKLLQQPVDLILLDLYLEDMRGIDILEHLRAVGELGEVPVICVTGSDSTADVEAAFKAGATDYMLKPYNQVILRSKVKTFLDLKRKTELLKAESFTDHLTNIANRRMFQRQLDLEWRRMARDAKPLSMMLVDMDHFKSINDTLGHQAGDECIKRVAGLLQNNLQRASDLVARFGGDEFVILLPGSDLGETLLVAEGLRRKAEHTCSDCPDSGPQCQTVTITLGCASVVPHVQSSPEELIAEADRQLYAAKEEGGRNCVRPLH
ncbi:MAG: diguanylate cyclase response regulator [Oceanospirillaceae bacterium]|jgi:diguanylate cyclase (GGDEF)-like protein|uniref:GGDEF domain-containing protein n=1 Tax=Marinobacterium litorale TaxID=404770 RepID=UPI000400A5D8|nr:diguanylate cyclase [Marinobacterium litorale]MBS97753.1 diguanylate cyclase response regulator [Oceanospirillaceae bacterium]